MQVSCIYDNFTNGAGNIQNRFANASLSWEGFIWALATLAL